MRGKISRKELEKRLKSKARMKVLRVSITCVFLFIYMGIVYVDRNILTSEALVTAVLGILTVAAMAQENATPLQEDLFVKDLLAMEKQNIDADKIKRFLFEKYGLQLYDKMMNPRCKRRFWQYWKD